MRVLLTCVGKNDPFSTDFQGKTIPGPLLTLLEERRFDRVYLFWNIDPEMNRLAAATLQQIHRCFPSMEVENVPFDAVDPSDYCILRSRMKKQCLRIREDNARTQVEYAIQMSSGTPQMQWTWISLVQSGLVLGRMFALHPRYLSKYSAPYSYEVTLDDVGQYESVEADKLRALLKSKEHEVLALRAEIERLKIESDGAGRLHDFSIDDLPADFSLREHQKIEKRRLYAAAIAKHPDNASKAARLLGVSPHTFRLEAERMDLRTRQAKDE